MTAAILAGGAGRRLGGVRKPWIEVGGQTILARAIVALRAAGLEDVLVLGATPEEVAPHPVRALPDRAPGEGPLSALAGALAVAPRVLLVPGDAPFLAPTLLRALAAHAAPEPGLVPVVDGRAQPQLARWDAQIVPTLDALLVAGRRALRDLTGAVAWAALDEPDVRALDPDLASFLDVDTPAQLEAARARAGVSSRSRSR